ncbi:LEA type 2 family protein [Desulfuromonas thiophila]|uniref:LEA type 2 family protein n=1 Tax=Desulfuromonas thiophila TaxID=57664 RepID=UPI0024A8B4A7|nr:LEA type 2 family protein [Desulfuromonas thiophila]
MLPFSLASRCLLFCLLYLLCGCASLRPGFEQPQINLIRFALAPQAEGLAQRFDIGIEVINPNASTLNLRGMSYNIAIEGHRILSGATANLPRIPAYGSAQFNVSASPDLVGSARLLAELFSGRPEELNFTFRARLDAGSLLPFLQIEESGHFRLPTPVPSTPLH